MDRKASRFPTDLGTKDLYTEFVQVQCSEPWHLLRFYQKNICLVDKGINLRDLLKSVDETLKSAYFKYP